jgi:hypothetical protein
MDPLVASGVITEAECQTLFSNIKELTEINRMNSHKLGERKETTIAEGKGLGEMVVGDIFCEMVLRLQLNANLLGRVSICLPALLHQSNSSISVYPGITIIQRFFYRFC